MAIRNSTKVKAKIKRYLRLTHRYTGIAMSLLFAIWFISGIFMIYTDFPSVSEKDVRKRRPPLQWKKVKIKPEEILGRAAISCTTPFHLQMMGPTPVYHVRDTSGKKLVINAINGNLIDTINQKTASTVFKKLFPEYDTSAITINVIHQQDQWIPQSSYQQHLPVYVFHTGDTDDTRVYISGTTGALIQMHDRRQRIMAWLGPIPHWIYFTFLRVHHGAWVWVIYMLSGIGIIVSLSGIGTGLWQFYKRRNGRYTPYRKRWFYWHHYSGLVFGVFTFTWVLSGLFSMNPGNFSPPSRLSKAEQARWRGTQINTDSCITIKPPGQHAYIKQVRGKTIHNSLFLFYYHADSLIGHCKAGHESSALKNAFSDNFITQTMQKVVGIEQEKTNKLHHYNQYYYDTDKEKPLPVLQYYKKDSDLVYYADPRRAKIVHKESVNGRWHRWLYDGLHTWNFSLGWHDSLSWQIMIILFLSGGTALSVTGVILTVRWLKK